MKIVAARLAVIASAVLTCGYAQAQSSSTEYRCSTAGGSNCSGQIPDAPITTGLSSTIPVPGTACVGGVRTLQVGLDITHDWVGDLRVRLSSPDGSQAIILDDLAETGGAAGSCQGDDVNAIFTGGGTPAACGTSIPAVSGTVSSFASLIPLANGTGATGNWTLAVFDDANDNTGFLNDWSIRATCIINTPLPGPGGPWLLVALLAVATLGAGVITRRR